ncbi:MAG TPA: tetratricopeptide repeat protein, partial [Candidatus Limnocylindria bacterium]|nr:tetratricopeptide repeat protein [Candidatus Limnocylindria bacterium]
EAALDAPKLAAYARGLEILLYHAEDSLGNPPRPPNDRTLLASEQVCQRFALFQQGFAVGSRASFRLPFHQRVARYVETALGMDAPLTSYAYNEVAVCHQALAAFAEAEPLMRRALAIDEQSYGADHPHVARDLNNLAWLLQATNRLAEAEPRMQRAYLIFKRSLGLEHPSTQIVSKNYVDLLEQMGFTEQQIQSKLDEL